MIHVDNQTEVDIDLDLVEKIYEYLTKEDVELIFVYDREIQRMNQQFRGIDKSTDVLSFPLEKMPNSPIGSIVISVDHMSCVANELNHLVDEEMALLFTHGLLHLLGYDHENDDGQMREKEASIMEYFNLPKSLIERTV
jgi:probable rRNA maturation factor